MAEDTRKTNRVKDHLREFMRELIVGSSASYSQFIKAAEGYVRSLPTYIDDAERDFGSDIYQRMMRDPAISSSINKIKMGVISAGPTFQSPVAMPSPMSTDPTQARKYQRSIEIRDFVKSVFENLQQPLEQIIDEILDFLPYGHVLVEKTYELVDGKYVIKYFKTKPKSNYCFVVDRYNNLVGVVGKERNDSTLPITPSKIIPREKFYIISYAPKNGDPRGTSILRPAYNGWYLKQQTWPQYLKFLVQFGTPSIAGYLPPDAGDVEVIDDAGTVELDSDDSPVTMTAEEAMLAKLISFSNGTAIVLPYESKLDLIQSTGDGKAYIDAFDLYDRQMTRAILISARGTMEAQHGSRADTASAADVVDEVAQAVRRLVEASFYKDNIKELVAYNYSYEEAEELAPFMSLSNLADRDRVGYGRMIADLARSDYLHLSQYPAIDAEMGLPARDFKAQMQEMQERKEEQRDREAMLRGALPSRDDNGD